MEDIEKNDAFQRNDDLYNRGTKSVPKPETNIGIDTKDTLYDNIIGQSVLGTLDLGQIESLNEVAHNRNQVYDLMDTMAEDPTVASALQIYAEDSTEYNDDGKIVWATSSDPYITKYITFLLDSLNVDKYIYSWAYSLVKYGDLYLHLYRDSEYNDTLFDTDAVAKKNSLTEHINVVDDSFLLEEAKETLEEAIKIKAYKDNDHFANYVEMVPNPAEMFELIKFGKTFGYVQAPVDVVTSNINTLNSSYTRFVFKKKDVTIYSATDFVHASLEEGTSRDNETVNISSDDDNATLSYNVRKGQPLLQNLFKIWRELMLLKNSVLLNRLTKSSIVRVINVEVGDMPKEQVGTHLQSIKQLIEQKSAIYRNKSMAEYTNPGPIENNIYVPVRNTIGSLTTTQIGGDVDVRGLADLDRFEDEFFGALGIPKQFLGRTSDSTGFNGGTSLSLISSRYAKTIKKIQNALIQAITDLINLLLLDRGLLNYVNKFEIHMLPPTTQEEVDRRENVASKVRVASDILNMMGDINDEATRLKILSALMSNISENDDITSIINDAIEKIEEEPQEETTEEINEPTFGGSVGTSMSGIGGGDTLSADLEAGLPASEEPEESEEETILPTPNDIGIDFTDNTNFEQ